MAAPSNDIVMTSASAGSSFTTSIHMLNYNGCGVQVVWSGLDNTNATIRLKASNYDVITEANSENANTNPFTMTVSAANHMFNVYDVKYAFIQVYYAANSVTTGTIEIKTCRKN